MTILKTKHLFLRPFTQNDQDQIVSFYGNPAVMAIRKFGVLSPSAAQKELQTILLHWKKNQFGLWAVIAQDSGEFAGECGLRWLEDESDIELSYGFLPKFQGRGLATEAAKEVVKYGFSTLQLPCIVALARGDNTGSHRVLEKLGMQLEWSKSLGDHGLVKYRLEK